MKFLTLAACLALAGCSTYLPSRDPITARIDHAYSPGRLTLTATLANISDKPVTIVRNPNFYTLSLWARDLKYIDVKRHILFHFANATPSEIEVIPPRRSIQFTESYGYRRTSRSTIEIYSGPISDPGFHARIRDSKLTARFSYGFYPDYFPLLGRFGRPNILTAEFDEESTFDAK